MGASKIAAQPGNFGEVGEKRFLLRGIPGLVFDELIQRVNLHLGQDESGGASAAQRLIIVSQKMRHARVLKAASNFTSRSAVRSLDAPARQPLLRTLRKTSTFQRIAYHSNFSIASARERAGKSVTSFQSMRSRSLGVSRSWA